MKAVGIPHQYACFTCRKSFKRPQFSGSANRFMTREQASAQQAEVEAFEATRQYKCPDCGAAATFMGIDFKAPPRGDLRGWRAAEDHINAGGTFYRASRD